MDHGTRLCNRMIILQTCPIRKFRDPAAAGPFSFDSLFLLIDTTVHSFYHLPLLLQIRGNSLSILSTSLIYDMATPFVVSLDLESPASGLSLKQIAFFGRVLVKVSSLSQAEEFLRQNFRRLDVYVDATDISSAGDIVDILNAGAAKAFVSLDQLTVLSQEQTVPSSRLVVFASSDSQLDVFQKWIAEDPERKDAGLCTESANVKPAAGKLGMNLEAQNVYKNTIAGAVTEDGLKQDMEQGSISIVPSHALTVERDAQGKISAASLLAAPAVPDQNGLYATSVTDERGVCLGLVWSSNESISEALRTGTGVYQSRKRGLWYKGQSSGDVQELIRIGFDCDSDCLFFVVNQIGRGM